MCIRDRSKDCAAPAYSYRMGTYKLTHPSIMMDNVTRPPPNGNATDYDDDEGRLHVFRLPEPTLVSCVGHLANGGVSYDPRCLGDGDDDVAYLYDLSTDPSEQRDIAADHPDVVKQIIQKVNDFVTAKQIYPCNLPPDGACYTNDPDGEAQCTDQGYFSPWKHD